MTSKSLTTVAVLSLFLVGTAAWGQGPFLRAEKNVGLAVDADDDGRPSAGDTLAYSIRIQNAGDAAADEVVLTDAIPFATALVDGSVFISQGELLDIDPIVVNLGTIQGGLDSASVGFRVRIDDPLPPATSGIVNQGIVTSPGLDPVPTDDPGTPEPGDATVAPLPGASADIDVPALGPMGLAALSAVLVVAGLGLMTRRSGS